MKLKLLAVVALLAVGSAAVLVSVGVIGTTAAVTTTFRTSTVTRADLSDDIAATGTVASTNAYGLAFGSGGHPVSEATSSSSSGTTGAATSSGSWLVATVAAKVGDRVTRGSVLATATNATLAADLAAANNELRAARIQLTTAQENYAAAGTTATRRQTKIQLYTARNQVAQAEGSVANLEAELADASLVAPIDGVVTAVAIAVGVDAPGGDAIVVAATTYQLTAAVVETDVTKVALGQPATVTVSAIDARIDGTVSAIAPAGAAASSGGVVSFPVTVTLTNPPASLRAGMTADVTITTATAANVLTVPIAALNGTAGNYVVRVVDATGNATSRAVTVGLITSTAAEVTSGLSEGEQVVTGTSSSQATGTTPTNGQRNGNAIGIGGFGGGGRGGFAP